MDGALTPGSRGTNLVPITALLRDGFALRSRRRGWPRALVREVARWRPGLKRRARPEADARDSPREAAFRPADEAGDGRRGECAPRRLPGVHEDCLGLPSKPRPVRASGSRLAAALLAINRRPSRRGVGAYGTTTRILGAGTPSTRMPIPHQLVVGLRAEPNALDDAGPRRDVALDEAPVISVLHHDVEVVAAPDRGRAWMSLRLRAQLLGGRDLRVRSRPPVIRATFGVRLEAQLAVPVLRAGVYVVEQGEPFMDGDVALRAAPRRDASVGGQLMAGLLADPRCRAPDVPGRVELIDRGSVLQWRLASQHRRVDARADQIRFPTAGRWCHVIGLGRDPERRSAGSLRVLAVQHIPRSSSTSACACPTPAGSSARWLSGVGFDDLVPPDERTLPDGPHRDGPGAASTRTT